MLCKDAMVVKRKCAADSLTARGEDCGRDKVEGSGDQMDRSRVSVIIVERCQ